ncbi:hypothetical protein MVEN_00565900 [Mycena venus]|uniref:C2H2-type domain-containing protein n=1 Tax=Mycena venus TaxID=2733690 RepID=A0A8H6YLN6_9AGAR|nr:hypothetical protein MVEN_00565900 [Mycena venus]
MSSQFDISLPSQDSDMARYFDKVHKAEEEPLSLWPLEDEPLLWFKQAKPGDKPDWNSDPTHFSLLWRGGDKDPIHITGPLIHTNLFGRTPAEAFADFPTDFSNFDTPPGTPLLTLSPVSPVFSPSFGGENSGQIPTNDLPDSIDEVDEMSQQLLDRMHLDSPPLSPQSPQSVSISHTPPPPPSPPTCNPSSINSLSDGFSSSTSSTLSVGTTSDTSSTYAVSPSPAPFPVSSSSSPAPVLPRSPRRSSSPTIHKVPESGEHFIDGHWAPLDSSTPVVPLTQIILEEHPMEDTVRCPGAKRGSCEDDEDLQSLMDVDGGNARRRKKITRVAPKRHPCTVPGCTESFTRPNDVLRHIRNAAIHKGSTQQAEALAASSTLCKFCGEELSRADAARRHELKASCGKRTIRRKSTYSMLPA